MLFKPALPAAVASKPSGVPEPATLPIVGVKGGFETHPYDRRMVWGRRPTTPVSMVASGKKRSCSYWWRRGRVELPVQKGSCFNVYGYSRWDGSYRCCSLRQISQWPADDLCHRTSASPVKHPGFSAPHPLHPGSGMGRRRYCLSSVSEFLIACYFFAV